MIDLGPTMNWPKPKEVEHWVNVAERSQNEASNWYSDDDEDPFEWMRKKPKEFKESKTYFSCPTT